METHSALIGAPDRVNTLACVSRLYGWLSAQRHLSHTIFKHRLSFCGTVLASAGSLSGGSLVHPHSQIITLPIVPQEVYDRMRCAKHFFATRGCCSVCKTYVAAPSDRNGVASSRLVAETEHFVAA